MNRILIVEDESRIASFLEKGLRKQGYEVEIATNGHEAIAKATTTPYDLLLLDLGLPGKDGWAVLRELRQSSQKLPVIIVTARDGETDRAEILQQGANDYLSKPFRFSELLEKVKRQLA
ncbi:MAG: response regulator [Oculatellaceae cyanobacterium Prado106]|jgi:DNA-binding response OmpR family regulator|nr:response regulator [Oculatellaceae cyanobacterium Prado106]